jgi:hypothetical protein
VSSTAPTSSTRLKFLLPCTPRDLVELFKEKLVNWKTPPFFKLAHDVLGYDLVVSRQRPRRVPHGFDT